MNVYFTYSQMDEIFQSFNQFIGDLKMPLN